MLPGLFCQRVGYPAAFVESAAKSAFGAKIVDRPVPPSDRATGIPNFIIALCSAL
jgi:hypothetical protein